MKLGITVRRKCEDGNAQWYVNHRYIQYFVELGMEVIFLTPYNLSSLSECDVLIISGGWDLNPITYGDVVDGSNNIDDVIDDLDFRVINYAYNESVPLLGICRGIQSINVFFGGTLKQDIAGHMDCFHDIYRVNNSKWILNLENEVKVNSFHHQSIKKLGEGLKKLYVGSDLEIEMIEHESKKIVGVQFHPEMDYNNLVFLHILKGFTSFDCV